MIDKNKQSTVPIYAKRRIWGLAIDIAKPEGLVIDPKLIDIANRHICNTTSFDTIESELTKGNNATYETNVVCIRIANYLLNHDKLSIEGVDVYKDIQSLNTYLFNDVTCANTYNNKTDKDRDRYSKELIDSKDIDLCEACVLDDKSVLAECISHLLLSRPCKQGNTRTILVYFVAILMDIYCSCNIDVMFNTCNIDYLCRNVDLLRMLGRADCRVVYKGNNPVEAIQKIIKAVIN